MIKRDNYGIVCQHSPYDENYIDGGDSSRAEGMLAMTGSAQDLHLLPQFEVLSTGMFHRHPNQPHYCDSNNFTRDQLVQLYAGLNKLEDKSIARRGFWSHAKRLFFCQNTHDLQGNLKPWYKSRDPLPASNIGQMIIASRYYLLYPLLPFCILFLFLEILFHSVMPINKENNQIIALCDVYGKWILKLYCFLDRKWEDKLIEYWGLTSKDFRYQPEIGNMITAYIENRIK